MFYDEFLRLCAEKGESQSAVAKSIGIDKSAVTRWSKGAMPRGTTLVKLANHFGVTVSYLVGETTQQNEEPSKKEDQTKQKETGLAAALEALRDQPGRRMLLAATSGMSEAQVEKVAAFLAEIRGGNKD